MELATDLAQGHLRQLQLRRGQRLLCRSGCLWLSHASEDIVLQAGDSHLAESDQQLLCEALQNSSLALQTPLAKPALATAKYSKPAWANLWKPHHGS